MSPHDANGEPSTVFKRQIQPDGVATELIRRTARRLARYPGFTVSDVPDIEQELHLKLHRCRRAFNPDRGAWPVFVHTVIQRYSRNLVRARRANRREPLGMRSLGQAVMQESGNSTELAQLIGAHERDRKDQRASKSDRELFELSADVTDTIRKLSPDQQEICRRLMCEPIVEVAHVLKVPRTTLQSRITKLRRRFEQAGLKVYLQRSSSPRP